VEAVGRDHLNSPPILQDSPEIRTAHLALHRLRKLAVLLETLARPGDAATFLGTCESVLKQVQILAAVVCRSMSTCYVNSVAKCITVVQLESYLSSTHPHFWTLSIVQTPLKSQPFGKWLCSLIQITGIIRFGYCWS
jgi:hypothetical protein